MKKNLLLIPIYVFNALVFSQNFMVFTIPDSISKNADAVVRYDDTQVTISGQKSKTIVYKRAITILNKGADGLANMTLSYDKTHKIASVQLEYFDAFGKSIKKVKKSDFKDYAAVDGSSLYNDDRVLHYAYTPITYPFTMVYSVEINSSNTAFIADWFPVIGYHIGVESSKYLVQIPTGFKLQKVESNFSNYTISKRENATTLEYVASPIPPISEEDLSPSFDKLVPSVKLAINKFHLSGVDGEAETWEEFGNWMDKKLLSTRNNLSPETRTKVKILVNGVNSDKEKAKLIYEYVQNKTRYISVQIGIGGWMPMMTDDVDKLGYGDCKALTYYTKSLLDEVNVPAYYSLVYSDDEATDIDKNLVSVQGNHAILFLPIENDSIFLECTSQKLPFGLNGYSTQSRAILTLTPDGGKIIQTNVLMAEDNVQKTFSELQIDPKGSLKAKVDIKSYGNRLDERLNLDGLQPHELDQIYKRNFQHVNNINFTTLDSKLNKPKSQYEESLVFEASNYATVNGNGSIIFSPNALNRVSYIPQRETNRKTSFEIHRAYKDEDQCTISIPENFVFSELPKPISIENEFGTYSVFLEKISENTIIYHRNITIRKGLFPKEMYEDYRKFKRELKKHDELKILITTK